MNTIDQKNNLIDAISKSFALDIIRLYKTLTTQQKELILSKQILRSGTSIGANVREAQYAQSRMDFISKLHIALKEAGETKYWLELLYEGNYIDNLQYKTLYSKNCEIEARLTKIINSTKSNSKNF